MGDAAVELPFIENLGADHLHDVAHSRRDQLALPGNAADQLEGLRPVSGAFGAKLRLVAGVIVLFGAAEIKADMAGWVHRGIHQVDDAADHSFMANAAVSLSHHFYGIGHLAWGVAARRGYDDDLGVQALRHFGIEVGAVRLFFGID